METTKETIWLTRQEVADRFRVPLQTTNMRAHKGYGPPYAIIGRGARYRLADVIAWENAQFGGDSA